MNPLQSNNIHWSENIIVADAEYIDKVAFNLTVYFERALNRRIFSTWAIDVALDGGVREGQHETQVVLIHNKDKQQLDYFAPSDFEKELNAKAFRHEKFGEFIVSSLAVENGVTTKGDFIADVVRTLCDQEGVKRITLFAMQPMLTGNFRQEVLGYSLMNALGIKADELK